MLKLASWLTLTFLVAGAAVFAVRSSHRREVVKARAYSFKQAITPKAPVPAEAADPKHRGECETALSTANHNGTVMKSWKVYGGHVNVRVRGGYYHADLEHKRSFDKVLRCVVSDGREADQGLKQVTYRDSRNDELVAVWEKPTGFKMAE